MEEEDVNGCICGAVIASLGGSDESLHGLEKLIHSQWPVTDAVLKPP